MRVLHFSAEPICDEKLNVSAELRSIADALLPGKVRRDTTLEAVPQTRPSDVDVYLTNTRPDVVHFSMHGEPDGLWLCDAYLEPKKYSGQELAAALEGMQVKLVVLNTCESEKVAEAIRDAVDVVIATKKTLSDDHAIVFSEVFYRSLQVGLTIEKAYQAAMRELNDVSTDAAQWYEIYSKPELLKQKLIGTPTQAGAGDVGAGQADEPAEAEASAPPAQHRMRGAAARLESIRYGAAKEAGDNRSKLWTTLIIAFALSLMVAGYPHLDSLVPVKCDACSDSGSWGWGRAWDRVLQGSWVWDGDWVWSALNEGRRLVIEKTVLGIQLLVSAFSWIKINAWLLFAFFAAPPALYLVEYVWLKRPLEDAERAAFGLALKAPESVDPDELVTRVEALVNEMGESNKGLFDRIRGAQE